MSAARKEVSPHTESSCKMEKELAQLGLKMREAQEVYFKLATKSAQSGFPEHIKAKREALEKSKRLEKAFDAKCKEILEFADQKTLF